MDTKSLTVTDHLSNCWGFSSGALFIILLEFSEKRNTLLIIQDLPDSRRGLYEASLLSSSL
jgi:hypothetical protein